MKRFIRRALTTPAAEATLHLLGEFGVNPVRTYTALRGIGAFFSTREEFRRQAAAQGADFGPTRMRPFLSDRHSASGGAGGHYFHQDLLVARKIYEKRPQRHVDVGSRVDGFVAHVACFREIEVFDVREQSSTVRNIVFRQADFSDPDSSISDYCDSLSSLHAIEHFGLGRYGDPVRYDGHVVAVRNVWRALQPNGTFYFSVPIGRQRVEFNGQRVFAVEYLLSLFAGMFAVESFSYVGDDGRLYEDQRLTDALVAENCGCRYGCGIFELRKMPAQSR